MDIGFLTACLNLDLEEEIIPWAKENGFQQLEIGGMHAAFFKKEFIEDIEDMTKDSGIKFSALGNFRNWLDGNDKVRENNWNDLKNTIETASLLKIPCVTTFVGMNNNLDYKGNLEHFQKEWIPILKFAQEKNVKIAIENCPGKDTFCFNGGNLMFCPGIMGELFSLTKDYADTFGLNFDPSHLFWQNVDVNLVVEEFIDRIFHTHVKDTKVFKEQLSFEGTFGRNIYQFRIPGHGDIDWEAYLKTLKDEGYKGVLSMEHEDSEYYANIEKRKEGLLLSKDYIQQILNKL